MERRTLKGRIEQALEQAGLFVAVEEQGQIIRLNGRVDSPEARVAATDIVAGNAPGRRIDNDLEVEVVAPETVTDFRSDAPPAGDLPESLDEIRGEGSEFEPDFTDQALATNPVDMGDEASADVEPSPDDGESVLFPPTDPVVTVGDRWDAEVVGGFAPTSMDDMAVAPSALDNLPGDEALADAVRRELREDALTTDLQVRVLVRRGIVHLRGRVPTLDDAESAEEVAGRIPGVREVVEELEVADL
jgi:osmotically-inducible protein OsmY